MAESNRTSQLDKYQAINIPSDIHIGIKLWFFQIVDIGVVGGAFLAASKIATWVGMGPVFTVLMYVASMTLATFCVVKMPYNPLERNYKTIIYALSYRKKRYWPLDLEEDKKEDDGDGTE